MYATHLHFCATICFPFTAGDTFTAIEIRNKRNGFSYFKTRSIIKLHQFPCQFVTQNAWIIEVRLRAFKSVKIRSTNSYSFYFKNGITR